VEERDDGQRDVLPFIPLTDRPEQDRLGHQIPVGQDGAQRLAGQPCRVDHHGRVVAAEVRNFRREGPRFDDLPERRILFRPVGFDEVAAEGQFVPNLREPFCEHGLRDQAFGIAVSEKMAEFVGCRLDVQRHGDAAQFLDSEIGDDELRAIGEHDRQLVPPVQPESPQMVGQGASGPLQLPVGDPVAAVDHGHILRIFAGAFRQHPSQIHALFSTPEILDPA